MYAQTDSPPKTWRSPLQVPELPTYTALSFPVFCPQNFSFLVISEPQTQSCETLGCLGSVSLHCGLGLTSFVSLLSETDFYPVSETPQLGNKLKSQFLPLISFLFNYCTTVLLQLKKPHCICSWLQVLITKPSHKMSCMEHILNKKWLRRMISHENVIISLSLLVLL